MIRVLVCILFLTLAPLRGTAAEPHDPEGEPTWRQRAGATLAQTWNSPTWDLYLPLYTWHNRLLYDKEKTDRYNELPLGMGLGKSMFDEDGDWHALMGMGFRDSHSRFQPYFGYGYQKYWHPGKSEDWRVGIGFTAGITARYDFWSYTPLPLVLPLAGVEYKSLALQAVYIPGTYNNGNVLFCWLRWRLN